ncbi:MAG: rubrerythrin family protein [Reinekea forsetii]|jgi:rubrerythrin|uniref:Rubrerythrin n=1 Tax=Reinekea forsetii TaxID=1336806 RepID=A0A2K8KQY2_9GAMM|nr:MULTISPECIES: rubrerythrin family protein [Reinekea]ATX75296.1 rubrerythrin [Reinekea forsetii]MDO7642824.1 rubrerythrin family protein [Reinekea forsetii]MDO7644836.1 rubrerythrin family protein [Reinekea forsetii]MDO7674196.1 rubrerythrin family protein [Reinekea forsetii]
MSQTIKNLEAAFAGESMANRKYLYFAKHARRLGAENVAQIFEATAEQETKHAHGHLELLFPPDSLSVETMLQLAIDGETYEYTTMYPEFRNTAMLEGNQAAVNEMDEQIEESKEHAELFSRLLLKAEKRFAALAKVEQRHAQHYQATLDNLKSNP